jgi:regulator of sigma E protease
MGLMDILSFIQNNILLYVGPFILVLSLLVFVHEWGHYIVARMCGVKVEVFSIGFGKELFGRNDKHGTRWKVSLIPLGGYVKMYGDTDPASTGGDDKIEDPETGKMRKMKKAEREAAFFGKAVWKRALIVAAGPAINYLFAIILLMGLYVFHGKPVIPAVGAGVIAGSAADEAGFKPHDRIVSIDGKAIYSFKDVQREMLISLDDEKLFVVNRMGEDIEISAKPEKKESTDHFGFKHSKGLLGLISPQQALSVESLSYIDGRKVKNIDHALKLLENRMDKTFLIEIQRGDDVDGMIVSPKAEHNTSINDTEHKHYNVLMISDVEANQFVKFGVIQAGQQSVKETVNITTGTLKALGQMIMGTRSATELGGIIRIGAVAGDMASQGMISLILFTALLSINLGLINLFPIPVLDGGHLVFYSFEAIFGKPVPVRIQDIAFQGGFIFLIGVMIFTNLNDIFQLFFRG